MTEQHGSTKVTAAYDGSPLQQRWILQLQTKTNILQTSITSGFVAGISTDNTSTVVVIPTSSGALGTAKATHLGGTGGFNLKTQLSIFERWKYYLVATYGTDNLSVYSVGTDGTLTIWNDNISSNANFREEQPFAFATSPNGDRAVVVGWWYDNGSVFPQIISMSATAATQTSLGAGASTVTYNRGAEAAAAGTDNGTILLQQLMG